MKWVPKEHLINENVNLISFKTDKFKTAIFKLSMVSPMAADAKETAMFSLMINFLRSGTEKYPEKEDIIKRLNDLYDASCSIGGFASGDNRILEISSEMLEDRFSSEGSILEGVIEVMKEMLLHPRCDKDGFFRADAFEREKKVICDKIKSEKNNSREYAVRRCREIMCKDEPYGQMTEVPTLMSVTREELTAFYKKFISESAVTFSYVGELDGDVVADKINKMFGDTLSKNKTKAVPLVSHRAKAFSETVEELNIKQGVLVWGFRTDTLMGAEDAHVMTVFNNVFGGTFMSRLFKTLREKMSLCYYCSSDYVSTKAVMYVSCGIDVANFDKAKEEILGQLKALQSKPISEEELKIAKDLAIKENKEIRDYPGAIATFFYSRYIYGIEESLDKLSEKIESVTADDVFCMAKKITPDTLFFLKGTKIEGESEEEYDE